MDAEQAGAGAEIAATQGQQHKAVLYVLYRIDALVYPTLLYTENLGL